MSSHVPAADPSALDNQPDDPARRRALQHLTAASAGMAIVACGGGGGGDAIGVESSAPATTPPPFPSSVPAPSPQWQGPWVAAQRVSVRHLVGTSLIGTVDIPSTFAVAKGTSLPPGATLHVVTRTQVRIDIGADVPVGSYTFAIEATAA